MRETSIMDNLNCKMQAHAQVHKENKLEEWHLLKQNNFVVKGASLKDHIGNMEMRIKTVLSKMIHHSIQALVIF